MERNITEDEIDFITQELDSFYDSTEEVQSKMFVINALLRKYYREMVGKDEAVTCLFRAMFVCEQYFRNMNEGEA